MASPWRKLKPADLDQMALPSLAMGQGPVAQGPVDFSALLRTPAIPSPLDPAMFQQANVAAAQNPAPVAAATNIDASQPSGIDQNVLNAVSQITGKGRGEKVSAEDTDQSKALSSTRTAVDPSEYGKALNSVVNTPAYQDQQAAEQRFPELMAMLTQPDPSAAIVKPLLALSDSQTGSHLMEGYNPGITPAERSMLLMKYADEDLKRKKELASEAIRGAASILNGNQLSQIIQGSKLAEGINSPTGYQQTSQFMRQTDREGQHLKSEGDILDRTMKLLAQGNPSANPTIRTALARLVEGTVRPQIGVIQQEGGDPSLLQGLENRLTALSSGQLPAEQVGQYKAELMAMARSHSDNVGAFIKRQQIANRMLPTPLNDMDLQGILAPYTNPHASAGATLGALPNAQHIKPPRANPSAAAAAGMPSAADIDAEIARRKSAKGGQ